MAEDPFDCFGDSDGEDDEKNDQHDEKPSDGGGATAATDAADAAARRRQLVEQANARLSGAESSDDRRAAQTKQQRDKDGETIHSSGGNNGGGDDNGGDAAAAAAAVLADEVIASTCNLWPDRPPPLYTGPMAVVTSTHAGGGRGCVATQNINPGTLLLVEEPIFSWPDEQVGRQLGLVSVAGIIRSGDAASRIVADMELLHPTREATDCALADGGEAISNDEQVKGMLNEMQRIHASDPMLDDIVNEAAQGGITSSNGTALQSTDILRMLLALRYNGFPSGLYLRYSMFNHDCDSNCIKFVPEQQQEHEEDGGDGPNGDKRRCYSEIRTTKNVKRGDALTISYLDPREVCHATRRKHLYDQHRFDIGGEIVNNTCNKDGRDLRRLDLVGGNLPPSSPTRRDEDSPTFHIETVLSELEEQLEDVKFGFTLSASTKNGDGDDESALLERAKALEMAALEIGTASEEKIGNPENILLVRCMRLHLDASEVLLLQSGGTSAAAAAHRSGGITNAQQIGIMCRFVQTARSLLRLQLLYLGEHHPDVAKSYQDLAQGIGALLSRSPKKLLSLGLDGMTTFAQCSREEDRCQREYRRISSFYPTDTKEMIAAGGAHVRNVDNKSIN